MSRCGRTLFSFAFYGCTRYRWVFSSLRFKGMPLPWANKALFLALRALCSQNEKTLGASLPHWSLAATCALSAIASLLGSVCFGVFFRLHTARADFVPLPCLLTRSLFVDCHLFHFLLKHTHTHTWLSASQHYCGEKELVQKTITAVRFAD